MKSQRAATYTMRDATEADLDILVAFTVQEAREAEGLDVALVAVTQGVAGAFRERPPVRYWVAECDGVAVGSVSVVKEWSNFRGGFYWWIQSIFIVPEHRGNGLVELLIGHVAQVAETAGALDLRLYAHSSNERALHAYRRCGFTTAPYVLMARRL